MTSPVASVSVIVACRNEAAVLREFLESLLGQDWARMDWEAIVADGMSEDGSGAILLEYAASCDRLHVISNPGRIVSTGLNAALRAAGGEVVLRMDAHTVYAADYCRRCVEVLQSSGARNVGGPARTLAQGLLGAAFRAAYHSPFSCGGARFHDEEFKGWVDTVPYGCWWRSDLQSLGGFDEELVRNQDDELNLRLVRAGGRIWQDPSIRSWYQPRQRLRSLFLQYFQYGYWKMAVIRKHRLPGSWRQLVPAFALLASVLMLAGAAAGISFLLPVWLALAGLYGLASVGASIAASRTAGVGTLPLLPVIFATYHLAYGSGFLLGLLGARQWMPEPVLKRLLLRLSR